MAKLFQALWCAFHLKAVFGLHLPRQAISQYKNSSVSIEPTPSSPSGSFCCQIYAPAVGLMVWYTDHDVEYPDGTVITEYLRYNNTVVPTATITQPPNSTVFLGGYIGDLGETPILPGVQTDINGPYYGGAYDGTVLLASNDTRYDDVYTTIASPTPFMTFASLYVFSGQLNSAGTCMGTYRSKSSTYEVASIAQSWFSNAARAPNVPYSLEGSGIPVSSFWISTPYYSFVSTQTSTWSQKSVITEIDDKLFTWLAQNPDVLSHVPSILSCSPVSAAGAPQLHIRVSFLTSSSVVTSTTNAMYINTASATTAVPASKTSIIGPTSTIMTITSTTKVTQKPLPSQTSIQTQPSSTSISHVSSATPPSSVQNPHDSNQDTTPPAAPTPEKSTEATSQGNTAATSSLTSVASGDTVSPTILPPETTQNQVSSGQPTVDASKTTAPDSPGINVSKPSDVTTKAAVSQEAGSSKVAPSQNNIPAADTTTQAIRTTDPVMIVIGGATATLLSSVALVIETTIPRTGGLAIQTSGTTDLARPSEVLTDVETSPVSSSPASVLILAPVVIGKVTATPIVSGGFIIGDQTIAPGLPAVEVSGTTYSIQTSQSNVIVNGQTLVASAFDYPIIPGVVGSATDRPYSSVAYAIGGQTLSAGGPAIEVSGTTYSLQPSGGNVLVNEQSASVSTIASHESPSAPVAFGEIKATPVASGVYIVADQTISRGGSAIQISGTTYSLSPSGSNVEIDGQPTHISTIQVPPATIIIGEVTAKPESSGAYYLVADRTLSPGGSAIEISGVTYSLPTSGANVVITGATSIMSLTDIPTVLTVVLGSATAVPLLAGGYIVGTQVLSPGGSAIEVSGTTYSLPVSGNTVIIDGQPTPVKTFGYDPVITIGSQAYSAVAASVTPLVIASQTLFPGGSEITVSGTVFSLLPSATGEVVVNGQTNFLAAAASAGGVLAFGSQQLPFTPLKSGIVVASQTLYPGGPAITVDGQMLSLPTDGGSVVIKSGTQTTTENLGNYIWQGTASSTSESISGSSSDYDVSSGSSVPPNHSSHPGITSTTVKSPTGTEAAVPSQTTSLNGGSSSLSASLTGIMVTLAIFVLGVILW